MMWVRPMDEHTFRLPHQRLLLQLPPILEVLHRRERVRRRGKEGSNHAAIVVLADGSCYVGRAKWNPADPPDRKLGYTIAVGRALRKASLGLFAFYTNPELRGRALAQECWNAFATWEDVHWKPS